MRDKATNGNAICVDKLRKTYHPGITPYCGGLLAECASVCLDSQGHDCGTALKVDGEVSAEYPVFWRRPTPRAKRCYADDEEATEYGASGVAILLVGMLTELLVIERARKGTRFDYWLGSNDCRGPYLQRKARLEVSGIRHGNDGEFRSRIRQKEEQVAASTEKASPAYVVVIEFGTPRARMIKKCSQ